MKALQLFSKFVPVVTAEAHCDIPCGIYEPTPAKIAAMTVLRMVLQIKELEHAAEKLSTPASVPSEEIKAHLNSIIRRIVVKEEHARICKSELAILWSDFFKPEHGEKFPALHDTFWKALKLCSKNKQEVNEEAARELIEKVDEIAKIFYEAKGAPERYEHYQALTDKLF